MTRDGREKLYPGWEAGESKHHIRGIVSLHELTQSCICFLAYSIGKSFWQREILDVNNDTSIFTFNTSIFTFNTLGVR